MSVVNHISIDVKMPKPLKDVPDSAVINVQDVEGGKLVILTIGREAVKFAADSGNIAVIQSLLGAIRSVGQIMQDGTPRLFDNVAGGVHVGHPSPSVNMALQASPPQDPWWQG